jgi:hypothetical protein
MPSFETVTRDHVLQALEEYDSRGADEFLDHYGFDAPRDYVLWHEGKDYDSKAVLGVAQQYATGRAAQRWEFPGGREGAAKILRDIGFEVTQINSADDAELPATGAWVEAADVGTEKAREAWAEAAREVLLEVARTYHQVVSYKELSTRVQLSTGIRTAQLAHYWIGDVLGRVTADCARREEPLLSALCVNSHGSVGDGYAVAAAAAYGHDVGDGDDHAAAERLACYQHFGATDLPADGGTPALTTKLTASRTRNRKAKIAERPVAQCPTCHMALPATGVCDYCD